MDLFYAITGVVLIAAAVIGVALIRQAQAAEARAAYAETQAAMAYGQGFRDATDEINTRRDQEAAQSYDKGRVVGWNACVTTYEDQETYNEAAAA